MLDLPSADQSPTRVPKLLTEAEEVAAREAFAEALRASSEVDMSCNGMPPEIAHKCVSRPMHRARVRLRESQWRLAGRDAALT